MLLVEWHGTPEEARALTQTIDSLCATPDDQAQHCKYGYQGQRTETCAAHAMLLDQRLMDRMLWARRDAARWLRGEFMGGTQPTYARN